MAIALSGAGVGEIVVANRTSPRGASARGPARRTTPIALDEIPDELVGADVLLSCTGSADVLIERADIEHVMERRDGRALLVVDVAVPRDVDPVSATSSA